MFDALICVIDVHFDEVEASFLSIRAVEFLDLRSRTDWLECRDLLMI
jgi:hypothetical protein